MIESLLPGYVQFGEFGQSISEEGMKMVHAFESSGVKVRVAEFLDEALWRKLCWNVPFNGLAIAGGGITTDLILADPVLKKRSHELMLEIQAGAKAYGIEIEDAFLDRQFQLTEPMGPYKPSSLIDFLDGKPVEVDAIWGEALRRGEAKDVAMPELKNYFRNYLKRQVKTEKFRLKLNHIAQKFSLLSNLDHEKSFFLLCVLVLHSCGETPCLYRWVFRTGLGDA